MTNDTLNDTTQTNETEANETVTPAESTATAPEAQGGAEEAAEATSECDRLAEAEAQIADLKDRLLRQMAEFDNFRKRTLKEKADLILGGGQKVLEALLPVLDDLERAQENIHKSTDVDTLAEGVDLILSKLMKALTAQGLKPIETEGAAFDTDFHEAVALIPATDEAQKNHIVDCVQRGYLLNEKVLRHAKVVVGQ